MVGHLILKTYSNFANAKEQKKYYISSSFTIAFHNLDGKLA